MNSCAPEKLTVPATLVTKFVSDLRKIDNCYVFTLVYTNKTARRSMAKVLKHTIT